MRASLMMEMKMMMSKQKVLVMLKLFFLVTVAILEEESQFPISR